MVFKASTGHAPLVSSNILSTIKGGKVAAYGGKAEMILVTLGPKGGRGIIPFLGGIVMGDWLLSKMKSTDLFIEPTRQLLGYKKEASPGSGGNTSLLLGLGVLAVPVAYVLFNQLGN
jgi:hypothetical protein